MEEFRNCARYASLSFLNTNFRCKKKKNLTLPSSSKNRTEKSRKFRRFYYRNSVLKENASQK